MEKVGADWTQTWLVLADPGAEVPIGLGEWAERFAHRLEKRGERSGAAAMAGRSVVRGAAARWVEEAASKGAGALVEVQAALASRAFGGFQVVAALADHDARR